MKTPTDKNILEGINKTPFTVPDGYFNSIKANIRPPERKFTLTPYLSLAAMFAVIVLTGTIILKTTKDAPSEDIYCTFYYCDLLPTIDDGGLLMPIEFQRDGQPDETEKQQDERNLVSDEHLIDYLIYAGTSFESIGQE